MSLIPQSVLEQTGDPSHTQLHGNIQRTFDRLTSSVNAVTAASIPFSANAADWVAPAPTNVQDALRRLAAAAGAHPVP